MSQTLPKFDNPPVIESVLGVEFEPLLKWGAPHFGLYWQDIRSEFPYSSTQAPLPSRTELFGEPVKEEVSILFPLGGSPQIRCWFSDESKSTLIQVQRDHFLCNWRKTPSDSQYPHFHNTKLRFEEEWKRFEHFVKSEQLGELNVKQCEVSYINHIELEAGWQGLTSLGDIFPCWAGKGTDGFLSSPDTVVINTSYIIPENRGRLRLSLEPVFRHADAKELIQFTVTAMVIPKATDSAQVMETIELGHEWTVRGFTDFTSAKMHSEWQRR